MSDVPGPDALTIGRVSELLGVPVPTLRSWHLRYGVALPDRSRGGHRRYSAADVQVLQALNSAIARGIAPRTAAQALREHGDDPHTPLELLGELLDRATAGDTPGWTAVLDRAESELGVEVTVDRLLVPALREIGRRWELQLVDVGVEHLTTAAARAWIAQRSGTAADRQDVAPVLLAAGAGNQHTVALEAFGMLLARRGWPTRELGPDTPTGSLVSALERTRAQAAVVTAHQATRRRGALEALQVIAAQGGVELFYAGGAFDSPSRRRGVPGTYLGTDLPQAVALVERQLRAA